MGDRGGSVTPRERSSEPKQRDLHLILAPGCFLLVLLILSAIGFWFFTGVSTPEISVPDVVGKNYEVATRELQGIGLIIEMIPENAADSEIGRVLRTSPVAGSIVKPGRPVILYVAAGEAMVPVPALVGTYFIEAENALKRAGISAGLGGLILGTKTSVVSDSPPGTILAQSPEAGTTVKVGSAVDITIAVAKSSDGMPDLVGMMLPQAVEALAAMGYSVGEVKTYFTTAHAPDVVVNQKPAPGTPLMPETVIRVDIAAATGDGTSPVQPAPPVETGEPDLTTEPAPQQQP